MNYMDIHNHIVFGVDDGAKDLDQSLKMVQIAYEEGIRYIVATPHYGIKNPHYNGKDFLANLRKLNRELKGIYPDVSVIAGNELYYSAGILDEVLSGRAKTLGGSSYCLIEFQITDDFDTIKKCIHDFTNAGYRVIIAHVERYECLQGNSAYARELKRLGAYFQVNCRTAIKATIKKEKAKPVKLARTLFDEGLVDFIASDAHSDRMRRPVMQEAVDCLTEYIGAQEVRRIVYNNIKKLVRNEFI